MTTSRDLADLLLTCEGFLAKVVMLVEVPLKQTRVAARPRVFLLPRC